MAITLDGTTGTTTPALTNSALTSGRVTYAGTSGVLQDSANLTFDGTNLVSGGTASATKLIPTGGAATGNGMYLPAANTVAFSTNGAEVYRLDSAGLVLVNQTTQTSSARFCLTTSSAQNGFAVTNTNASAGYTGVVVNRSASTGDLISFNYVATTVGVISTNGTTTTYGTSSDYRLKENIQPMTGALARVSLLKPCTYTWKSTGEASEGFIAHELAEVCPDAVSGQKDAVNEDGSIKSQAIDTSFLVATLTAAIQELTARVAALEAK